MDKKLLEEATVWLTQEISKFGLIIPEKRVSLIVQKIIEILTKEKQELEKK